MMQHGDGEEPQEMAFQSSQAQFGDSTGTAYAQF